MDTLREGYDVLYELKIYCDKHNISSSINISWLYSISLYLLKTKVNKNIIISWTYICDMGVIIIYLIENEN